MSKILVGFSPYRNVLKQERASQIAANAPEKSEVVKLELSPLSLIVGLFVLTLVLGGLYLMDFNKNATKGYILKRLEVSKQELEDQNDMKTLALAKAKAMDQMMASGAMDKMRKPGQVEYIYGDSVIAKAN